VKRGAPPWRAAGCLALALLAGCGSRDESDVGMAGHYVLDESAFQEAVAHDLAIARQTARQLAPDWKPHGAKATAAELAALLRVYNGVTVDVAADRTFRMDWWARQGAGPIQKKSFGGMWASSGERIVFSVDRADQRRDPSVGYRYTCKRTLNGFVLRHRGVWPLRKVEAASK